MFESLYSPLPDADRYLQRIRFDEPVRMNRETLDKLMYAHLTSVPFENIDIYDLHRPIELGIPELYEKIVINRRGGYCFELNGLFMALLTALGFNCHAVVARVLSGRDYTPPLSHRATVVAIGGERYYCDVGFGGPSSNCSLKLDDSGEQVTERGVYRFEPSGSETTLYLKTEKGDAALISLVDKPAELVDFIPLNYYTSHSPSSLFVSKRMAHIVSGNGRVSIDNNTLKRSGQPPVTLNTREELAAALAQHFGIHINESDLCLNNE